MSLRQALTTVLFFCFTLSSQLQADEFPGRKLYPGAPTVEREALNKRKSDVVVVDVRSEYEFQTLRMVGAINIPLASPTFVQKMDELRKIYPAKEIVVYCNGRTCKKSYKATLKCRKSNIKNVTAYDAGIFDWARSYPDQAILLGETPVNPKKLIPKSTFKKKLLTPTDFGTLMAKRDAIVLDIRDSFQREALALFPGVELRVDLDDIKRLDRIIEKAKRENKTVLVYDAAGKQVRWLMYYLEKKGVKNYAFMEGGAHGYFADLRKQF